jgi:ankyrin repeat protein
MDYNFCVKRRLLFDNLFYNENINENINGNINNNISNMNYKLLKYINGNEIMLIIELFKEQAGVLSLDLLDNDKNTLLMIAIKKIIPRSYIIFNTVCPIIQKKLFNIIDVCELFIINGCNINNKNIYGESALILAIKNLQFNMYHDNTENGNIIYRLIEILIKNNADINLPDNKGYTALMHCINLTVPENKRQCNNIINLLLINSNINITYLGNDGQSAFVLALNNNNIYQENLLIFLGRNSSISLDVNFTDDNLLLKMGDIYKVNGNIDKMKKCYIRAIEMGNSNAKSKLFYYYCENNRPDLITEEESKIIKNIFTRPYAFYILLKSKYFHSIGECSVCLEDVNNIIKLPCHNEHFICLECVYRLRQNVCPFCRSIFPRNIIDF